MLIQVGLSRGFVAAMDTERLLIRVNARVLNEGALFSELIATLVTREGTIARVSALVNFQFAELDEGHGAKSTSIVPNAIVTILVQSQSATRDEGLVALGA